MDYIKKKIKYENKKVTFYADLISEFENPKKEFLFLHNLFSNKETIEKSKTFPLEQILKKGYLFVAPTLRSHFDKDTKGTYRGVLNIGDIASDLKVLIEKINCKNLVICGHSFGGTVGPYLVSKGYIEPPEAIITANAPRVVFEYGIVKQLRGLYFFSRYLDKIRGPLKKLEGNIKIKIGHFELRISDFSELMKNLKKIKLNLQELYQKKLGCPLFVIQNVGDDKLVNPNNAILYSTNALKNPGIPYEVPNGVFKGHTIIHNLEGGHAGYKKSLSNILKLLQY